MSKIFDQSYEHWDRRFTPRFLRWSVIVSTEFNWLRKRWLFWIGLVIMWIFPATMLLASLFQEPPVKLDDEDRAEIQATVERGEIPDWARGAHEVSKAGLMMVMFLGVTLAGLDLISKDIRHNTFALYFSRPMGLFDYLLGKLGALMMSLALMVIIPVLVVFLRAGSTPEFMPGFEQVIGWVLGYQLFACLIMSLIMLGLSSSTGSRSFIAIFYFMLLFLLMSISQPLKEFTDRHYWELLSPVAAISRSGDWFLGAANPQDLNYEAGWSVVACGAYGFLGLGFLIYRIRKLAGLQ